MGKYINIIIGVIILIQIAVCIYSLWQYIYRQKRFAEVVSKVKVDGCTKVYRNE